MRNAAADRLRAIEDEDCFFPASLVDEALRQERLILIIEIQTRLLRGNEERNDLPPWVAEVVAEVTPE